jgi:hypothetical protein
VIEPARELSGRDVAQSSPGAVQCCRRVLAAGHQQPVELGHQQGGGLVTDGPESGDYAGDPCLQETCGQTGELVEA